MAKQQQKADFNELNFDFGDSFADFELDLGTDFETRYIKPPKTKEIPDHLLKFADAKKLADKIKIEKGRRHFVIINGTFYFGDFIEALVVKNLYWCKEMIVSTLSMNQNNIDSLHNMMKYKSINKLKLIVSDYFFSHERNDLIPYLYQKLDFGNRFQLAVAGTHCKTCQFETTTGLKVIIHGSANLRSSSNIEQIMIEENEALYDFNKEYQDRIIEKYATIDKSIRGKELWRTIKE